MRIMSQKYIKLLMIFSVGLLLWFMPYPEALSEKSWHLFVIFIMTIVSVVFKPVPMGVTGLGVVAVCTISDTLTLSEALQSYSAPVVWLVLCAFLIARGLSVTGLGTRLAYFFMQICGRSTLGMGYGFVLTDFVLSPAVPSNTARGGGLIFPVLKSLVEEFEGRSDQPQAHQKLGAYLIMVSFQANVVTSSMFLTAMAANPLILVLAGAAGIKLTWGLWALACILPGLVCLLAIPPILYVLHPPKYTSTEDARLVAKRHLDTMGAMKRPEWIMAITFLGLLVLWIWGDLFGISTATAALLGIVVLLFSNVLTWEDVLGERTAWETFIWFGALLMLATELQRSGFVDWFGAEMLEAVRNLSWQQTFISGLLVYFIVHYFYAGVTALVSSLYAIILQVMLMSGVPGFLAAMMLGAMSCLVAGVTHYGTGPSPVYYGANYVLMKDWWRIGLIMALFYLIIFVTLGSAWWYVLGLWSFP